MVQTAEKLVSTDAERYLLIYMIGVLFLLSTLIIIFFIAFQKRKNKLLLDQIEQQKAYDAEIARTQTEIQEQTLKHVGRELHDNVGHMLIYAQMQLGMLSSKVEDSVKDHLKETRKIVSDSLEEVRSLSKSLNIDVLLNMGFVESIANEMSRLKRLSFSTADLQIKGDAKELPNRPHELVLFRILQEFFSNSVKYSQAERINVVLDFQAEQLMITATDNGVGFDIASAEKGSGLINMQSRAALIGTEFELESKINGGTKLILIYPIAG